MSATSGVLVMGGTVAALAAGFAGLYAAGYLAIPTEDPLGAIAACEESITSQLRSPSSYRRISAKIEMLPPLSFKEFLASTLTEGCEPGADLDSCSMSNRLGLSYIAETEELRKEIGIAHLKARNLGRAVDQVLTAEYALYKQRPPEQQQTARVRIEYDAVNAYNAPIRDVRVCAFGPQPFKGKYTSHSIYEPAVNVASIVTWSLKEVSLKSK